MRQIITSVLLMVVWSALPAQETTEVPNPPAIPTPEERAAAEEKAKQYTEENEKEQGRQVQGVDIKQTVVGDSTVTEYSRGGQVHMIKVKPKNMPPQYIDENEPGGSLQHNDNGLSEDVALPKWKIGSW